MSVTALEPAQVSVAPPARRAPIDIKQRPKLSREQAGHIRHFHNLVDHLDGQWPHIMGGQETGQAFMDAYRYQLANMVYASSVAHYHRLPALRSVFKPLLRTMIYKMLRPEVWAYWFNTSMSGKMVDPDITELRKPWPNPVVKENIMYSGHLLLMISLYAMLFDDDEFEKEDSLVFEWDPTFWGMGPETFTYSTSTLQDAIVLEMERNGYLGVCCEPNMIFVICNQFPIIAIRYNDVRNGVNTIDDLLVKYRAAWEKKGGLLAADGQINFAYYIRQDRVRASKDNGSTTWAAAFMNSWNSDFVKASADGQALGYITNVEGVGYRYNPPLLSMAIRKLVAEEGASPSDPETLKKAKEFAKEHMSMMQRPKGLIYKVTQPLLGYTIQWLSELGKTEELNGLLEDVDKRMNPTWEKGGLFYSRHDAPMNDDMEWTAMDPYTGNTGVGYGRLNVPDGQKIMWDQPWTREILQDRPWIDGVGLATGVNCLRGEWLSDSKCLVLTMRTWDASKRSVKPTAKNLGAGRWAVYANGEVVLERTIKPGDDLEVALEVDGEECDVIFAREDFARFG